MMDIDEQALVTKQFYVDSVMFILGKSWKQTAD